MHRFPVILAGAVAAVLATAPALAAPAKKPAPAKKVAPAATTAASKESLEHAVGYFNVFVSAMGAKDVPEPVKETLMGCIYSNPFSKIATGIDTVISQNAGKLDRSKPNDVFNVLVRICGYNGPTNAPAPAPAPGTTGR